MELNSDERKAIAQSHLKIKDEYRFNQKRRNLASVAFFISLGLAFLVYPLIWQLPTVLAYLSAGAIGAGIFGSWMVHVASELKNIELFKRNIPNLSYHEYKQCLHNGRINDFINELNVEELKETDTSISEDELEEFGDKKTIKKRKKLIKILERKLRHEKELNAFETEEYNKAWFRDAYLKDLDLKGIKGCLEGMDLRRSAIEKDLQNLTPEEEDAINQLK